MKILICDDEALIRNVIKEYLILESYEVLEAENGLEAIEIVKNNDVDLIVMDIMMPKMDGYQAVREIKKIKDIPFIMLSARNEEFDKLIGFDIGVLLCEKYGSSIHNRYIRNAGSKIIQELTFAGGCAERKYKKYSEYCFSAGGCITRFVEFLQNSYC